jgi:hypothetical protein
VTRPAQQVEIALRKAGIAAHSEYKVSRFAAQKVRRKLARGTDGPS